MKTLIFFILTITLSGYSLAKSAEKLQQGYSDHLKSSLCIKNNISQGVDRGNIEVIGGSCKVKGVK